MASVEMSTSYPVVLRLLNSSAWRERASGQGLTLVHFSAQLEPCLTQETTLHTLNAP